MKNRISLLLGFSLFLIAASAHAQPKQTWVSATGVDENPDPELFNCPRIAPCKTFAGAIAHTAAGGEISVLDAGDFGSVVITKSITINGGSMLAGIFAEGTNAVIVNVVPGDPADPGVVILRGLSINGGGTGLNGIRYLAGAKLIVEHCSIYGFTQNGIFVSPLAAPGDLVVSNTTLTGVAVGTGSNGIDVVNATSLHVENCAIQGFSSSGLVVENSATGIGTFVKDTVMRNNGGNVIAAGKAVFDGCRFERNFIGFGVSQGAKATLHDCVLAGNLLFGFYCHDAGSQALVDGSQISNNLVGIQAEDSGQVRVSNSNITNNTTGLSAVRAGTILSRIALLVLTNTVNDNGTNGVFTGTYSTK
ncbi:MAG: right-handed parallel beta-helix repeat-containing protein [Pyrinomonadaceae bacterium]